MSPTGASKTGKLKADVVVMGSGGGLAAAVAAKEGRASVILLEKEGILGGYTRQANGLMACESPVQKRQKINVSTEEVFRRFMSWTHLRRVDPRVVRAYFNKTGDTIRWLEAKGVEFELMPAPPGGLATAHIPIGMGAAVQKALIKSAKELGVEIFLHTSGKKILRKAKGGVTGVVAVQAGKELQIATRAVIIATGGFGDNRALLRRLCPDYYDGMALDVWPHHAAHSGDGILMAEAIGAEIAASVPNYHMGPYYPNNMYPWLSLAAMAMSRYAIWVNKRGQRFTDEAGSLGAGVSGNAILMQPGKIMYTVFDDVVRKYVEEGPPGVKTQPQRHSGGRDRTIISEGKFPGLARDLQKEAKKGGTKISDSWDEIARWIGADPRVLKAEIDEYNSFCDKGSDEVFTKDRQYLIPLRQPPYYAMRCCTRVGETLGGIKVNERMEVLDTKDNAIPGVYAAGVVADGFEPEDYNREIAGCAMGFAVNSGHIAGESAAKFILGK